MDNKKSKKELSPLEQKLNGWVSDHLTRIKFVDKIFFVDHLRTMIHASLSLVEALGILEKEVGNKRFKSIIGLIKKDVEQGQALNEVLSKYPVVFPPIYVKMVEAGEVSGKLDESLKQIVIQMKKTQALTSSIRSAMVYPAVILMAMIGLGILMTTMILPKLIEIFREFDSELPLATRVLISFTNFVNKPLNLILIVVLTIGLVSGFAFSLKKYPKFKSIIHKINLNLPIFGKIIKKINLARFSLTLSSLLKSTLPIIQAVEITSDTCSNVTYRKALKKAAEAIKTGQPLSEILATYNKIFPPMVTEMIMVGERSGEVDRLLEELSEFYGDEVDKTMKNFSTIIEPIIILVLGVAVAGVAVAIIMPMYSLVNSF